MMHEFGHTAGLDDLYKYPNQYPNYLMSYSGKKLSIPILDIRYINQVYRNAGGKPR